MVWNEAFDQYGAAVFPPATAAPTELRGDAVVQIWYSPAWYDPPTGLRVAKTVADVVATGRGALVSFPWYLNANATTGPSFESLWLQDVQSNKTCQPPGQMTKDVRHLSSQEQERALGAANCTCYGRGGDVEDSCYDVTDAAQLARVLGGEAALWGEAVDAGNFERAAFLGSTVVAERLWSPRATLDVGDAKRRLVRMQEVMAVRGFADTVLPPF